MEDGDLLFAVGQEMYNNYGN